METLKIPQKSQNLQKLSKSPDVHFLGMKSPRLVSLGPGHPQITNVNLLSLDFIANNIIAQQVKSPSWKPLSLDFRTISPIIKCKVFAFAISQINFVGLFNVNKIVNSLSIMAKKPKCTVYVNLLGGYYSSLPLLNQFLHLFFNKENSCRRHYWKLKGRNVLTLT